MVFKEKSGSLGGHRSPTLPDPPSNWVTHINIQGRIYPTFAQRPIVSLRAKIR
jgi:hypothetical protein